MFCFVNSVTGWPSSSNCVTAASSRSKASSIEMISNGTPRSAQIVSAAFPGLVGGVPRRLVEGPQQLARLAGLTAIGVAMRNQQGQQRVTAPRERDPDQLEGAGLLEVVADPERERIQNVLEQLDAAVSAASPIRAGKNSGAPAPGRQAGPLLARCENCSAGISMVVGS